MGSLPDTEAGEGPPASACCLWRDTGGQHLWEHAPAVELLASLGGRPVFPENESCGFPGFAFCPGAGMWKGHGQVENGQTWAESRSHHPALSSPTHLFLSRTGTRLLWHQCARVDHAHSRSHTVPRLQGKQWPGQPGRLLARPWGLGGGLICPRHSLEWGGRGLIPPYPQLRPLLEF